MLTLLPDELLEEICINLSANDWKNLSEVCRRLRDFINRGNSRLWKTACDDVWCIDQLSPEYENWLDCYKAMHRRYGRYEECYFRVFDCWSHISSLLRIKAPRVLESLRRNGICETQLNELEEKFDVDLPLEYRCSYRLCDGQLVPYGDTYSMERAGVFGSYDEDDSGDFLVCLGTTDVFRQIEFDGDPTSFCCLSFIPLVRRYYPVMKIHGTIVLCLRKRTSQCTNQEHQQLHGSVVSIAPFPDRKELFIYARSFIDYLEQFAYVYLEQFPAVNGRLLKYTKNSTGETGPFEVSVGTAFFRERSHAAALVAFDDLGYQSGGYGAEFRFYYRITIAMNEDGHRSDSCQLQMRHWEVTDDEGQTEIVDGPGVVGQYPTLRPGDQYSWISGTWFSTPVGDMCGYFTMERLNSPKSLLRIECPKYVMRSPESAVLICNETKPIST